MAQKKLYLWQLILAGPFLIWMGIHEYGELADLERHGGHLYVDRLTHFLYTIGGKNLVLIGTCGFGAFYIWALVRWIKAEKIRRAIDAGEEIMAAPKPEKPRTAPREAPPRITDDPFRAPPAARPILAVPTQRPIETPVVASSTPDDGPKLLR